MGTDKSAEKSEGFVWFHNASEKPEASVAFYEKVLGWKPAGGPPGMTMFAGVSGPFAGVASKEGKVSGWVPYVKVPNVDAAAKKAEAAGATIVAPRAKGPAGDYVVIRDPGGATLALWQAA